jgi:hypothetical protein
MWSARRRSSGGRKPLRAARARAGLLPSPRSQALCLRCGRRSAPPPQPPAAGAAPARSAPCDSRSSRPPRRRSGGAWPARQGRPGGAGARRTWGSPPEPRRAATSPLSARTRDFPAVARPSASPAVRKLSPSQGNVNRTQVLYPHLADSVACAGDVRGLRIVGQLARNRSGGPKIRSSASATARSRTTADASQVTAVPSAAGRLPAATISLTVCVTGQRGDAVERSIGNDAAVECRGRNSGALPS